MVWSNEDIRDKFQKNSDEDFNISQLYSEIINWLNNRHLEKTQHKYKNKTEANNHLKNIMRFLEQIAYESLVVTGKLVERKLVEDKKDTLDIDEVIEQGLLKREGINYQFIHLTFQEYLAALRLNNQLLDNHTKNEKAAFIGEHRNEPKYLMTLKFLAGIVNNDDNQELIEIFWEAITCNVNGILELGIERKIILLMHLLTQSKINGKFDNRIPHLKQIQELIDEVILKDQDITIWEQHIIDSGYLSENIVNTVNEKLRNKETIFQEFKTAIKIITSLINRGLVEILTVMPAQKAIIISKKLLIKPNYELKLAGAYGLFWAVKAIPTQEAITILKELLVNPNSAVKLAVARDLPEMIKTIPSLIQEVFIFLREEITNHNARDSLKSEATESIVKIVKARSSLVQETFTVLKMVIMDPNNEDEIKSTGC